MFTTWSPNGFAVVPICGQKEMHVLVQVAKQLVHVCTKWVYTLHPSIFGNKVLELGKVPGISPSILRLLCCTYIRMLGIAHQPTWAHGWELWKRHVHY